MRESGATAQAHEDRCTRRDATADSPEPYMPSRIAIRVRSLTAGRRLLFQLRFNNATDASYLTDDEALLDTWEVVIPELVFEPI